MAAVETVTNARVILAACRVAEHLASHIPGWQRDFSDVSTYTWVVRFNDASTDEQVFDLIDKTLADLGAL